MKVTPYVTPYIELSVSQPFTCLLVAVGCGLMGPLPGFWEDVKIRVVKCEESEETIFFKLKK